MKAIISVFNKDKVIEFARALNELGIEVMNLLNKRWNPKTENG